jgi:hypothetical protein
MTTAEPTGLGVVGPSWSRLPAGNPRAASAMQTSGSQDTIALLPTCCRTQVTAWARIAAAALRVWLPASLPPWREVPCLPAVCRDTASATPATAAISMITARKPDSCQRRLESACQPWPWRGC